MRNRRVLGKGHEQWGGGTDYEKMKSSLPRHIPVLKTCDPGRGGSRICSQGGRVAQCGRYGGGFGGGFVEANLEYEVLYERF